MINKLKNLCLNKTLIQKYSKKSVLLIEDDYSSWVLNQMSIEFKNIFKEIDIDARFRKFKFFYKNQSIFYLNKYKLLNWDKTQLTKAIHFPHGYPNNENNIDLFSSLKKNQHDIQKIHVTHEKMKNYMLEKKIDEDKIMKIYNLVDLEKFKFFDEMDRRINRKKYNINENDFVIGSFQKDGIGWNLGNKPKLEKGPDIFIEILKRTKKLKKNILVILTGPSRGFVINELKKHGIKYLYFKNVEYEKLQNLYSLLDLYLITSREEGGPRSLLESMATGVPVISSKVGQCEEIIKNGENGFLVDIGDIKNYIEFIDIIISNKLSTKLINYARETAEVNSYNAQKNQWKIFFRGIINS